MISRDDLQRLIDWESPDRALFSLYLDMSVNSDNKRTYGVFLNQKASEFAGAAGAKNEHRAEQVKQMLERVAAWIESEFDQSNRGLAFFGELGSERFEAYQLPVPFENRLVVNDRPVIGPLLRILGNYHHHGIAVVDREHLRLISVYMGRTIHERSLEKEAYPTAHDVQAGGYSAKDYQKRKAEETRHFFKEFADELARFDALYRPNDLVILGTHENVKHFQEFLQQGLRQKVVFTGPAPEDGGTRAVLAQLTPFFRSREDQRHSEAVVLLRDRVEHEHYATAGVADTLEQLQEGKVDTLVVGVNGDLHGARCEQCGFYLAQSAGRCPYCGGDVRQGVDLVETMIRLAADQDANLEFVDPSALNDMEGVGALLRF